MKTDQKQNPNVGCAICGVTRGLRLCTGCHLVGYCSVSHQKQHWPSHKPQCVPLPPFKLNADAQEISGKYAVATRDMVKGATILEESPLFHYNTKPDNDYWQCTTCGAEVKDGLDQKFRCVGCHWPVCSEECQKAPIHANNECKIFAQNHLLYTEKDDFAMTARAFSIRCRNPGLWNDILDTVPLATVLDQFEGMDRIQKNISVKGKSVCEVKSKFPEFLQQEDKDAVEEIRAQMTVLAGLVGFPETVDENLKPKRGHMHIYKKASHFSHSCAANCVVDIGPFPEFKIRIRTAVPVKKGDILTINRIGHLYLDTRNRQEIFRQRFHRYCTCPLCSNPRELGTFQGAVVCGKCREKNGETKPGGYLLPVDPTEQSKAFTDNALWECSVCGCIEQASKFLPRLTQLYNPFKDVATENMKKAFLKWEVLKLLKEERDTFLHPNHWIIQQAVLAHQDINGFPSWREDKFHQVKRDIQVGVERLTYLLDILNKTCPGIQPERIRICQFLGDGMLSLMTDACTKENFANVTREDALHLETQLTLTVKYFEEALAYWEGLLPPRGRGGAEKHDQVTVLKDKANAARRLMEHVQATIVQFRKDAEEIKDDKIEDWGFRYKKIPQESHATESSAVVEEINDSG